jgi:hypothetical protein
MFRKMLSELWSTICDYRECGDLRGHLRALVGVLLGYIRSDDARWEPRV